MLIAVKYLNNELFLLGRQVGFEEIRCIKDWQRAHWLNILLIKTAEHSKRTKKESGKTLVKRTKISRQPFHWNRQCLFCGEEYSVDVDKKNPQRWRESFECRISDRGKGKLSFKEVILLVRRSVITWMLILRFDT